MSPARKTRLRRVASRDKARRILQAIVAGELETYVGFRQLYRLWIGNNAAVQELRPMFRLPGIEPDGTLSVTPQFNETVRRTASEVLGHFEDANPDNPPKQSP